MKASSNHPIGYLTLDKLNINRKVARRLPPALAFRYHAIPVGKANGSVTVAMAHPEDRIACAAIAEALKAELYVVQSDSTVIDEQLAELWPAEAGLTLRMLLYHHDSPNSAEIQAYARYLGDLLRAQLTDCRSTNSADVTFDNLVEQARHDCDLIIFGEPCQSLIGRLVGGSVGCKAAEQLPASVLIARCPRWPLRKILLVTRGQGFDNIAIDWIIRLAQPSGATVTVLAVQPPMSGADSRALAGGGLSDWLATDTPLGQQLGRIARQLVNWEIEGKLRFRQGLPDWQVKTEINEGDYDLVVLAADPEDWWTRRILGRLVGPLLGWIDRPVLIAKSANT
jgi:nucleotide-binding universal stress UspA family protein